MLLSNDRLRRILKPMGSRFIVSIKKNQKSFEMYKYIKINHYKKSHNNSSNRDEKQMFETKTGI